MSHPQTGGSYSREKDGSLKLIETQVDAAPAPAAEEQATVETPADDDTSGKKGRS